ncbi:hypothetical protein KFL_013820025 [Klebsormidium nitens]|uniref:Reverse transcriptase Ty1/copia-type domain-containing protein n=1 Tax=Klebsormidium nitens TaxID=105231 RepID=A0A1Y1IV35_KLENI|nr:hypothetical protein KFL_013820025 [Klebsormidium nitens]|eukprot:GAQ93241.1 hypothetical protein KFL_013820025 [Klebsormidium nitens]
MPVASVRGSRCIATFLDDYSKHLVVVPMKQKSEVAKVTRHVISRLKLQTRKKLKSMWTDRGKQRFILIRDVIFDEGIGGDGVVKLGSDFTDAHLKGTPREHPEPQTYQEAGRGEESELWRKSMSRRRDAVFVGKRDLGARQKPEGVKPIPITWIYKIQQDAFGDVERYKSRLVTKGYL